MADLVAEVAVEPTKLTTAFAEKPVTELAVEPARVALLTEHLDLASQMWRSSRFCRRLAVRCAPPGGCRPDRAPL